MTDVPKIDERAAPEIEAQLVTLLEQYTSDPGYAFAPWNEYDAATRLPKGRSAALTGIFARFAEIVIERLNQVPEKNFLAFLDLLGASRQPPQPARAPLTFTLAAGSAADAQVPVGTQVAAPPAAGEKDPVVFETERALTVTTAQLSSLVTLDPQRDSYGDWSARLTATTLVSFPAFQGDRALPHVLYLGDSQLLGYAEIKNLRVRVTLDAPLPANPDPREVHWECWDGTQWRWLKPVTDPTAGLTKPGTVAFGDIEPIPASEVNSRTSRWLRCRLLTPVTPSTTRVAGMVRAGHLPRIRRIIAAVHLERTVAEGIVPDLGFTNAAPLDLGKEFFPFGEKPRLHDTFFLASAEAFSKDRTTAMSYSSARVELDVQVANSHLLPTANAVRPSTDLELRWECWTGSAWKKVGGSTAPSWLALLELDATPSLATKDSVTSATIQGSAQAGATVTCTGAGVSGGSETHYLALGADGRFADRWTLAAGVNVFEFAATLAGRTCKAWATAYLGTPTVDLTVTTTAAPVATTSIALGVAVSGGSAGQITSYEIVNGANGSVVTQLSSVSSITVTLAEGRNDLLVKAMANAQCLAAKTVTVSRVASAPAVDAGGFSDGTFALTQSGVVTLRLPDAMAKTAVNGQENFWLRVRLAKGDYGRDASYVLKDPVKPEDGFTLVPASYRPPIVTAVKIGYELTPRRPPEACFAFNRLAYSQCVADGTAAFVPFAIAPKEQQPALHVGFALPAGRSTFPNDTISLYHRVAEPKYGERAVPLSPETSAATGAAGTAVTHTFTITDATAQDDIFDVAVLGGTWPATFPGSVSVGAGATETLDVTVDVPGGQASGTSDRAFLRLSRRSDPDTIYGAVIATGVDTLLAAEPPGVAWQYWNGTGWSKLAVEDGSENFTRSGLFEFVAPADLAASEMFGSRRYWLRAIWDQGDYAVPPRLSRILLNTTLALQTVTVFNETLGSGNGTEDQQFVSTRKPVLAGQRLEVREPDLPSAAEQAVIEGEEGDDAVSVTTDAAARPREIWVRWHEVPDFYGSGARDRHYTINHLTGEIRFGDGVNGLVPPRGTGNIRLARYQTGGGSGGNRAAGAVAQLKTTVPYVEKAVNPDAAAGGADAETVDALFARLPRTLRHGDRAVTLEDYEDLALLASSEVARARCVPLRDLAADPLGDVERPGCVSVIVVPNTDATKPLPTLELLTRVEDYLEARADAAAALTVVGPLYIRVDVCADVALAALEGASAVERAIRERLAEFLHPLTGGLDGNGWGFGRAPHRSDFLALIESVPGVDHIRYLQIDELEDQPGVRDSGRYLVFSGEHRIDMVFEET